MGSSRCGQVPNNPDITLSTECLHFIAASSTVTAMPLKVIFKFFYSEESSMRDLTGSFLTAAPERQWSHGSVVPGSTAPWPRDRLKDGHSTMENLQVLEPEKTRGSKENCTIYEPCNVGKRNLSEPQVLRL